MSEPQAGIERAEIDTAKDMTNTPASPRTLFEAFEQAMKHHKDGNTAEAAKLYLLCLRHRPDQHYRWRG